MTDGPWPQDKFPVDEEEPRNELAGADITDEPAGSRGVALTVAGLSFGFPLLLPWVLVAAIYAFLTVYAIVKAIGSAPDEPNASVVVIGIVGLVTGSLLVFAAAVWLIGRTADPRKRRS